MRILLLRIVVIIAVLYRFWLWEIFAGWEESDYGNIAMVRGVYESGFQSYDMNHMPGYYGIAAIFLFFYDDAVVAGKLAATLSGALSIMGIAWLMKYMVGAVAAIYLVLLLMIQPEFSLYAASALREPVYTMFVVGLIFCAVQQRWWFLGLCAGCAFLVRFEFPLIFIPLVFVLVSRHDISILYKMLIPLMLAIMGWTIYCWYTYETIAFWGHATSTNIETGMGGESRHGLDWCLRGASIAASLFFYLLPSRLGWLIWFGWLLAPMVMPKQSQAWLILVLSYGAVGVWLLIAFVAQHDPNHNLYWKWMYPLIPLVGFCGVWTWWRLLSSYSNRIQGVVWFTILVLTIPMQYKYANIQVQRANRMYRPQVDLAKKIEKEIPNGRLILVDNIPACWMNRIKHEYRLISWFDIPVPSNNPKAFAQWLVKEDVWGVLWFQEEWTQAPKIAPFLQYGGVWSGGKASLQETARENEYGWIFYQRKE